MICNIYYLNTPKTIDLSKSHQFAVFGLLYLEHTEEERVFRGRSELHRSSVSVADIVWGRR